MKIEGSRFSSAAEPDSSARTSSINIEARFKMVGWHDIAFGTSPAFEINDLLAGTGRK